MSNYEDRYEDGDRTSVREPVSGQMHQPAPMPPYVQQQQYPQQQYQYPPQHYGSAQGYGPPQGYGHYGPSAWRPRREYPIETKPFFLTSEFVGSILAIAGIAITAAASDAFGAWRAWILITAIVVGYMVSRGIAKSGTRSHSDDPREHINLNWGRDDSRNDS